MSEGEMNAWPYSNFVPAEVMCPCCSVIAYRADAMEKLQLMRDLLGRPLFITSGYRCEKHNENVGGAPESYHLRAMGFDLAVDGQIERQDVQRAADVVGFGGVGVYRSHVHVDIGPPRKWTSL